VPPLVQKPDLPYGSVNFDFPLTSVCNPRLYVYKNDRRLLLVQDGILIRDYLVGLGPNPCGDKKLSGDGRTPEGSFYVCVKNPTSQFYKSLGLSYPDPKHAEEAFLQGAISPNDFRQIVQAFERKGLPPWNTPLGGAIFIHGGGGHKDWTKGCIAVGNSAMDELFDVVSVGTPVEVLP
jgi:murein L,D-transpeptidase YafK